MDGEIAEGVIALLGKDTGECSKGCYVYKENSGSGKLKFCESLFLYAVRNGHVEIVKQLIKHGVDINVKEVPGLFIEEQSALHVAIQEDYFEIAKLILENGACANETFISNSWNQEESLLYVAAENGNKEIVNLLLDFGANPNYELVYTWGPVYVAAIGGHVEIVKLLIDRGTDCDFKRILNLGAAHGRKEIVTLMHKRGVSLNGLIDGESALYRAAAKEGIQKMLNYY